MADAADIAFDIASEFVARGLSAIVADLPAGVAGECDDCGEMMPRLIGGRCGFCRDGRRPPADQYPDPATIAVSADHQQEETFMPNPKPSEEFRNVGIMARGSVLQAIRERAEAMDISFGKAAASLIEHAIARDYDPNSSSVRPDQPAAGGDVLSVATVDELFDELRARVDAAFSNNVMEGELQAATARADVAERQLATMRKQLGVVLTGAQAG